MTKRMVMAIGTNLLVACLSLAFLHPAFADTDATKTGPNDKTGTSDKPMANDKTGASDKTNPAVMLNANDKAFMMEVARGNQAEVELGQVAADHGGSSDVIKFGQQMVNEHTRMGNELKQLAAKKGVALPQELDAKSKLAKDRLMQAAQRTGVEFDREYMKKMLQEHEQDVSLFQREMNQGKDPELQSWAQKTLPTLQEHLRMARNINDTLKKNRTANR